MQSCLALTFLLLSLGSRVIRAHAWSHLGCPFSPRIVLLPRLPACIFNALAFVVCLLLVPSLLHRCLRYRAHIACSQDVEATTVACHEMMPAQ